VKAKVFDERSDIKRMGMIETDILSKKTRAKGDHHD
jgi:hypothetical protein